MMGIIGEVNGLVAGWTRDESLASLLKDVMTEQLVEQPAPIDYYYVTHLTNPAQAFFSRAYPEVRKSPALARKLALGNRLHSLASVWFRTLPNFVVEEGTLDGAYVGLPGVRGKIDYRVGDSIFELKTKDNLPENPEEIISSYPQDLEQLAFYSVIHPHSPTVNHLIFMKNSAPFSLRAFRVTTEDTGTVKSILKSRMRTLSRSFETHDPSRLGRCRYYDSGCQFRVSSFCSCDKVEPLDLSALRRSVRISFDPAFTRLLENVRDTREGSDVFSLSTRDIIAPRKHYMDAVSGLESLYEGDERDEYKACAWISVNKLKKRHGIDLSTQEKQSVIGSQREPRVRVGFRWLKLKSSIRPSGEIVPYLLNINLSHNPAFVQNPSTYHLAELGIVCATYGKSKGLIIRVCPNLGKLVQVFQVTYENIDHIQRMVKGIIDNLEEAEQKEDLLSLPPCPTFMNDDGKCPLIHECHSGEGSGCTN
jgi:hypothetical protein